VTVAAVILAAGASTRLGQPKQLIQLGGEKLLERAIRIARQAGCEPVVVVLGAAAEIILAACDLEEAAVVINADWEEGMAASIACGIAAVDGEVDGAIVMACDQPAVTPAHLRNLMNTGETTASRYAQRSGVPAYFAAAAFEDLMELQGDAGARDLLKSVRVVDLEHGELDIDTSADLKGALELFALGRI
jgi:molybdenum cofactor cytidylyltransferase